MRQFTDAAPSSMPSLLIKCLTAGVQCSAPCTRSLAGMAARLWACVFFLAGTALDWAGAFLCVISEGLSGPPCHVQQSGHWHKSKACDRPPAAHGSGGGACGDCASHAHPFFK